VFGNTSVTGTLGVTGASTFTGLITANGGAAIAGGDFSIGSSKFNVTGASGATSFAGDLAIATHKVTVAPASGNTAIAGTLTLTGALNGVTINAATAAFGTQFYHIRDERSSGTAADSLTSATWNTRALNTEKSDDLSISPSSNQLSLVAGTYF